MRNVPQLRFAGFEGEWEEEKFSENFDTTIPKNSLSRDMLTNKVTKVKNIHYGDIHKFFDNVIQSSNEKIPYIINDDLSTHERYFLQDGDIIFTDAAEDNTAGKCVELDIDDGSNIVAGLHTIPARPIKFGKYFYGFYLNSNKFHNKIIPLLEGTKVSSISKTNLNTLSVIVPNVQEQEKIGDLFRKIDALIEKQESKISKMEDFKKSMLQKIFPKKGELVPDFRFDGFDGEWKKVLISELLDYEQPTKYIVSSEDYIEEGTPVLTANKSFLLGYTNEKNIYDNGEVILIDDFTLDNKYVDFPFMVKSSALKILTEKNSDLFFVYNLLNNIDFISEGHKRHYISVVQNIKVLVPLIEEQQKIGRFFKNLDTQIETEEKLLESYKQMKKSLLQKMFV